MNAKHDGEGACWEQFLVVIVVSVVVETVRCCEGKSVSDLKKANKRIISKVVLGDSSPSFGAYVCTDQQGTNIMYV